MRKGKNFQQSPRLGTAPAEHSVMDKIHKEMEQVAKEQLDKQKKLLEEQAAEELEQKKTELEEEAKEAAETYNDLERVETQGGLLGMDHHKPPPAPKILSKEERRNSDSGYVRPLRRR